MRYISGIRLPLRARHTRAGQAGILALLAAAIVLAAMLSQGAARAATTFTVNSTGDAADAVLNGVCETATPGECTLRAAIQEANSVAGADNIHFSIGGGGVQTITPATALPIVSGAVSIDGTTQPGYAGTPIVVLNGNTPTGPLAPVFDLVSGASTSTIRGLSIQKSRLHAIMIRGADDVTVVGNYIGVDTTGTVAAGNSRGVSVYGPGASNNVIGGTTAADRNVIAGNGSGNVQILDGADGTRVIGNYIGTNATGTAGLSGSTTYGIYVTNASNTTIGGPSAAERNIVSGHGVSSTIAIDIINTNTTVQNNYVGTDVTGTYVIGNANRGIVADLRGTGHMIKDNLVSGNLIGIEGAGIIRGNLVGTDVTGTVDLGNTIDGMRVGRGLSDACTIGGPSAADRNIVSGNGGDGIEMGDGPCTVQGNYIGVDASGVVAMGNGGHGIYGQPLPFSTTFNNTIIGGSGAGEGNVIAANSDSGIHLEGRGDTGIVIRGNRVGTDTAGTLDLGNGNHGIVLFYDGAFNGPNGVAIGGAAPGDGNIVRFNNGSGMVLARASAIARGNIISDNGASGVRVEGGFNRIHENSIDDNGQIGIDLLGGFGVTANDAGDGDGGGNSLQNYPVIASAVVSGGALNVTASLNSTPSAAFTVDYYLSAACDPSGYGEGETWLGSAPASTDGGGNTSANATLAPVAGGYVTATATNAANETSEFSACVLVVVDTDSDGVIDSLDNCVNDPNPLQENNDADAEGDACDADDDNDTVADGSDNCQFVANTPQDNNDADAQGDACDTDDDNDLDLDADDNCQFIANPGQENNDKNLIIQLPDKVNDATLAMSDEAGDVCDADDDNDGRSDADELAGAGCAATSPLLRDTDGDRMLDGPECFFSLDPNAANAAPAVCGIAGDADSDGVLDGREFCYYGTSSSSANTDGDTCSDGREAASINGDQTVSAIDLSQLAQSFGPYSFGAPAYKYNFDITKDGSISASDLSQVAQRFGPCNAASIAPSSLSFPTTPVSSTSAAQSAMLKNEGSVTLSIASVVTSGPFSVSGGTCGATLAPGTTCSVDVVFSPVTAGAASGSLTVTDSAPGSPRIVSLSGTGDTLTLTPASWSFGLVPIPGFVTKAFTLSNGSGGVVGVTPSVVNNADPVFSLVFTDCPPSLSPGQSCTIMAGFSAVRPYLLTGSVIVTNTLGPPLSSAISGTGF